MPAGDKHSKTEKPTAKRKREARRKGQVARSPDVASWMGMLGASFLLPWYFGFAERRVLGLTARSATVMSHPSVPSALRVLGGGLLDVLEVFVPLGAGLAVLAVAANVAQTGPGLAFEAARPQLSRVSPAQGFRRLASPNTAWELAKQFLKLVILGAVAYQGFHVLMGSVTGSKPVGLAPLLAAAAASFLRITRFVAVVGLALGVADYAVQRHRLMTTMKMTKQEVKDEHREQEGDPTMKGELKKRSYTIARSRMMASVKTADVVVANPTHVAVALQYRAGSGAPRVVAKGTDHLAARIREEASLHRVPVVEDPPLARYLHVACELGDEVPEELYVVVARLLAFVYSLPAAVRGATVHRPAPSVLPDPGTWGSGARSSRADRRRAGLDGERSA